MIKNVIKKEQIEFEGFIPLRKGKKTIKTYQSASQKLQNQHSLKRSRRRWRFTANLPQDVDKRQSIKPRI